MRAEQSSSVAIAPDVAAPFGFPDRVRLPIAFDPVGLQKDLARLGDAEWTAHFVPQHYEGQWSVLPLRAPAGAAHPILRIAANPGTTAWDDTEWLRECPCFREVLAAFECEIRGARLMRLAPGSLIREHRDERLGAEWGNARLHIPTVTDAGVDFRLNGIRVAMAAGETWYLRLADPHSVVNAGSVDRVHLVIDAVVNPWLADLLRVEAKTSG